MLATDPATRDICTRAMSLELGKLSQGFLNENGTDTVRFMEFDKIRNIPKNRIVSYAQIVVDYCPQKQDPNRVRITAGGI